MLQGVLELTVRRLRVVITCCNVNSVCADVKIQRNLVFCVSKYTVLLFALKRWIVSDFSN